MGRISEILQAAQQRAKDLNLPYEGALFPKEAFEIAQSAPNAKLIDVRSRAELDWVGRIIGATAIEWASYPGMKPNPHFISELEQQISKESLAIFFCRSGARSHHAAIAATHAGYRDCYNMLEGFEGDMDNRKRRNTIGGWRAAGLPWEQS